MDAILTAVLTPVREQWEYLVFCSALLGGPYLAGAIFVREWFIRIPSAVLATLAIATLAVEFLTYLAN